jgi:MFS family permease
MGKRVLAFSSIGHALMHMMTAFYAVIVLTLAITWGQPPESLLELYAPAAILLGVMSLPAGWASDRFGAPLMMVVMFTGLGLSSIACGLVPRATRWPLRWRSVAWASLAPSTTRPASAGSSAPPASRATPWA